MTTDISNRNDLIDLRDVIARVEELRELNADQAASEDEDTELRTLEAFLEECKGNGGDELWEGDWYPVTLIRDTHFTEYAKELAEDIGAIDSKATWPNNCIDWEFAARELQQDYIEVDFDGMTYYTR